MRLGWMAIAAALAGCAGPPPETEPGRGAEAARPELAEAYLRARETAERLAPPPRPPEGARPAR